MLPLFFPLYGMADPYRFRGRIMWSQSKLFPNSYPYIDTLRLLYVRYYNTFSYVHVNTLLLFIRAEKLIIADVW
jgi:hypothetical protein